MQENENSTNDPYMYDSQEADSEVTKNINNYLPDIMGGELARIKHCLPEMERSLN